MRETYITTMPDKSGAFLKASEIISSHNANIVRVSFNKAVDMHTLFIDVEAEDKTAMDDITAELAALGYLSGGGVGESKVIMIELTLRDVPGTVLPVLKKLNDYDVNISYMNSEGDGSEYQHFRMGLLTDKPTTVKKLLDEISMLCDVRILDYDITEKVLDNTVFYVSFTNEMRNLLSLDQSAANEFMINSNRIMQLLDEKDETPLKTFEYARRFAKFVVEHKNFDPIITHRRVSDMVELYALEPPCGSNTYILDDGKELLFIDCGFACYYEEMCRALKKLNFENRRCSIALTHGDIDHAGLLHMFDRVYVSDSCKENFALENEGKPNWREQNRLHMPYCRLSKIISGYKPPNMENIIVIGKKNDDKPLSVIGELIFGDMVFCVYEGNGGHVRGETIYDCKEKKLMFSGDNMVNISGFSEEQAEFNKIAPYLMQSVNVDSKKATVCRKLLADMTKGYTVCPGHGRIMDL